MQQAPSPIQRFLQRLHLKRNSSLAFAQALDVGAETLFDLRDARPIAKLAKRMRNCILSQTWRVVTPPGQATRVVFRNKRDCRSRLCAVSSAFMAKRQNARFNAICEEILKEFPSARGLLLTVTLPTQLLVCASVAPLQRALKRFWKMPAVVEHTLGHLEVVEVKLSGTSDQPTLHIHAHCIVMVRGGTGPDSYFPNDVPRIHQSVWASWWQQAARLDVKPIVDIRAIGGRHAHTDPHVLRAAMREVLKYAFSPEKIYHRTEQAMVVDPRVALALHYTLRSKQLIKFDRCFKDAEKRLKRQAQTTHASGP